jgi:hypothetical protein
LSVTLGRNIFFCSRWEKLEKNSEKTNGNDLRGYREGVVKNEAQIGYYARMQSKDGHSFHVGEEERSDTSYTEEMKWQDGETSTYEE